METQRILMRSLTVVVFASVIWTITDSAQDKPKDCCTVVSSITRAKFTDPIIGARLQKQSLECVKAVVFETERGDFCLDPRLPWVKEEVKPFLRAQRNKGLMSTPPPASSLSKLTPEGGSSQSTDKSKLQENKRHTALEQHQANRENDKKGACCTVVSRLTQAQFTDPIIGVRLQKQSPPCVKAIIIETERGDFCLDPSLPWVQEKVKQFLFYSRPQRNKVIISQ